jgi:N-acetylglutamate synthase-like GNAT family acetyltransferase
MTTLRTATADDLDAINHVIDAAVMTWNLPERVKRLSLPTYHYNTADLDHLDIQVALDDGQLVGVSAIEPAEAQECPAGQRGMLLHGLYVHPDATRRGIGSTLLEEVLDSALEIGYDGVLVRAQKEAGGFFEKQGFSRLPVTDDSRDYATRYWWAI